jgi:hypothetical protein
VTPAPIASPAVSASANGAVLALTVAPRASKTGMERLADGTIRVRLAAPPVDGAANTALLRFLADSLDLPKSRLSIASGAASRRKRIAIDGLGVEELDARLLIALAHRK